METYCHPPTFTPIQDELQKFKDEILEQGYHKRFHSLTPAQLKEGFALHTISSLEIAIRKAREPKHICLCKPCESDEELHTLESVSTIGVHPSLMETAAMDKLHYLMGLPSGEEEEEPPQEEAVEYEEPEDDLINGTSEAMRKAQRYLREHKIFEFFQFLIAHLLSAAPRNPIKFLINLLEKCLIYRSGISDPPLLYDKKHIVCLFNLMDRMKTDFIDFEQYKTGMHTLGIKSYNPKPPMTPEKQVTKVFFIEESYECLKDLLNDMIRKRRPEIKRRRKVPRAPPPSIIHSVCPQNTASNFL